MAKKQTRRSVSLSRVCYEAVKLHCLANEASMAQYLERLIASDLEVRGIKVTWGQDLPEPPPRNKLLDTDIATIRDAAQKVDANSKIAAALEFTRQKLAAGEMTPAAMPKPQKCWCCDEPFQATWRESEQPITIEVLSRRKGQHRVGVTPSAHWVHRRCKRSLERMPGGLNNLRDE